MNTCASSEVIIVDVKFLGVLSISAQLDACLLILTDTLLKEVGLALE